MEPPCAAPIQTPAPSRSANPHRSLQDHCLLCRPSLDAVSVGDGIDSRVRQRCPSCIGEGPARVGVAKAKRGSLPAPPFVFGIMHVSRLSPSPPSACARAVCLLVIITIRSSCAHHLITSAPPPHALAHQIRAQDATQLRDGRGLYSSSAGVPTSAKEQRHACRANRRSHGSITRLRAHCRLHRSSRQLRHASWRCLAGVGEPSRQRFAGRCEQRRRLAAFAAFFSRKRT